MLAEFGSLLRSRLALDGAVGGSAADSEDLHEVGDGVFAGSVHADEFGLLTVPVPRISSAHVGQLCGSAEAT